MLLTIMFSLMTQNIASQSVDITAGRRRIVNFHQGICRSLEASPDGNVAMKKTEHVSNQLWNFEKKQYTNNAYFRISSKDDIYLTLTRENISTQLEDQDVNQWFDLASYNQPLLWDYLGSNSYYNGYYISKNLKEPTSENYMLEWYKKLKNEHPNYAGNPTYWKFGRTGSQVKGLAIGVTGMFDYAMIPVYDKSVQFRSINNPVDLENYWLILPDEHVISGKMENDLFDGKLIHYEGISILSSNAVSDEALYQLYYILMHVTSGYAIKMQLHELVEAKFKIVVLGKKEKINMIPEYKHLSDHLQLRNLGANSSIPVAVCAEENLLCDPNDPHYGEDTSIKSIAHSLLNLLLLKIYPDFSDRLAALHKNATKEDKWSNSLAFTSIEDYFVQGVESWFNTKPCPRPPNQVHNHVGTRSQLWRYDLNLHNELYKWFPADLNKCSCQVGCTQTEIWGLKDYPYGTLNDTIWKLFVDLD